MLDTSADSLLRAVTHLSETAEKNWAFRTKSAVRHGEDQLDKHAQPRQFQKTKLRRIMPCSTQADDQPGPTTATEKAPTGPEAKKRKLSKLDRMEG